MTNLARNLAASVTRDGAGPAIRLGDAVLSFAQLNEATARVAGLPHGRGVSRRRPVSRHRDKEASSYE